MGLVIAQVQSPQVPGAAPDGNPLLVAGQDGAPGSVRVVLVDAAGRVQDNVAQWLGSTAPTVGQKAMASSVPTVIASDQAPIPITTSPASSTPGIASGRVVLTAITPVPIRENTYTEQTSDAQRSLVSSSASDAAAGTGARTVRVTYYTATLAGPYTDDVTLNGTTPVNTSKSDICFIEKIGILTAGSNGSPVGTISLKAATGGGGVTVWSVAPGSCNTFGAHHYVAANKTCCITGSSAGIKGADTTGMVLRGRNPLVADAAMCQLGDTLRVPSGGYVVRPYGTPIEVAGPRIVMAYALPDSTSSRTYYASFDFYDK